MKIPNFLYISGLAAVLLAAALYFGLADSEPADVPSASLEGLPEIAVEEFTLANGLKVLLHRDNTLPVVATGVWYKVGSSHEWRGRTGLAHLVEHLMFNGSRGYPDDYYRALDAIGGRGVNGATNRDYTSYFQTIPSGALDQVLWLESDRMGWMQLDAAGLQEQLAVVQNEKQQRESGPYASVGQYLARMLYPEGHPYSWPVIGYSEDLAAATPQDVERFRSAWYAPNNAVLLVAGDIDLEKTRTTVERYFGDIPRNAEVMQLEIAPPQLTENRSQTIADRVPYPRLYRLWHGPTAAEVEQSTPVYMACSLLGGGRNSPLYRRLVLEEKLANFASCYSDFGALAGAVMLVVEAREAEDLPQIRAILDEVVEEFAQSPPDKQAMQRVVNADLGQLMRSLQRQKSRIAQLASGQVLAGDPQLWRREMLQLQSLTPQQVRSAAQHWLSRPRVELTVLPGQSPAPLPGRFAAAGSENILEFIPAPEVPPSRPKLPEIGAPLAPTLPQTSYMKLVRGCAEGDDECAPTATALYLVQRDNTPLLSLDVQFSCLRDPESQQPAGLAQFTTHMMNQGTESLDLFALRRRKDELSGLFSPYATLDYCGVSATFPAAKFDQALQLTTELAYKPRLDEADLERERTLWLSSIQRELSRPRSMALRALPPLLYGSSHPYGVPFTGTGYAVQIENILTEDLREWHRDVFDPARASLVIAGDINRYGRDRLLRQLEARLGGKAEDHPAPLNTQAASACSRPSQSPSKEAIAEEKIRIVLVPVRDSRQSIIAAGQPLIRQGLEQDFSVPLGGCDRAALYLANWALGGAFTSRYNMALREEKGWSYNAGSYLSDHRGPPLLATFTSVQASHTALAVQETVQMLRDFVSGKPMTRNEMQRARQAYIHGLPASMESLNGLRSLYSATVGKGRAGDSRPLNWWMENRIGLMQSLRLRTVRRQVGYLVKPESWVIVVVGDPRLIEGPLRALGLGEVEIQEL